MRFTRLLPLLLVVLLTGCAKVKDPEFRRVENFRLKNFGLQNAVIGFNVTYYNPNNFGVTVKEAEADVYMDSVYLGKFVQDSSVQVVKNSEFSLPLSGTIELQTALKLDLRSLGERDILLKADGNVKVGKAGIFVNKAFHYQGKHRLDEIKFK
jgi:LEA14-like dessication related protein